MAEGIDPTDPTTEKTPLIPGTGDDDDDDDPWPNLDWSKIPIDPEEPDRTQPFEPGGASTPYPEGEMTNLPQEQSGRGESIPKAPKYTDFVHTEDKKTLVARSKEFIKAKFPKADFSKIVISLGQQKGNEGKAVALGPKGGETVIFKQDNTFTAKFSKQYSDALDFPAEKIIAEDNTALQDTQRRLDEAQQAEARLNTQAEKQEQETQKRQRKETQLEQINQRIENMVNEGGTEMERQMETDRLKREKAQAHERHRCRKKAGKGICKNSKRTRQGGKRS